MSPLTRRRWRGGNLRPRTETNRQLATCRIPSPYLQACFVECLGMDFGAKPAGQRRCPEIRRTSDGRTGDHALEFVGKLGIGFAKERLDLHRERIEVALEGLGSGLIARHSGRIQ